MQCDVQTAFRLKDTTSATTFAAVYTAVRDERFWASTQAVHAVAARVQLLRGRLGGCPCHREEAVRHVRCPMKGRNCKDLAKILDEWFASALSARADVEADEAARETVDALTALVGAYKMKFAYVWDLPYLIWQCDAPEVARRFLDAHDSDVAAGRNVHRVAEYFCGYSEASLRSDFQDHANGRGISERLRTELTAYQLCCLDETCGEASHRDTSRLMAVKNQSKIPFCSATQHLSQNLEFYGQRCASGHADAFHEAFRRWKVIGQPNLRRYARGIPIRCRDRVLTNMVYRLGSRSLEGWDALANAFTKASAQSRTVRFRRSLAVELQVDFLRTVLEEDVVFTLPAAAAALAGQAQSNVVAGFLLEAEAKELTCFKVTLRDPVKKKMARSSAWEKWASQACPMQIQPYVPLDVDTYPPVTLRVRPEGAPYVTDMLTLAEWPVLRTAVRKWPDQAVGVSVSGGYAVTNSRLVAADVQKADPPPALILVEALLSQGWEVGPARAHVRGGPKIFDPNGAVNKKAYLQCLWHLPQMFANHLPVLHLREPVPYYMCLLKFRNRGLSHIVGGLGAQTYAQWLEQDEPPEVQTLQTQPVKAAVASDASGGEDDVPIATLGREAAQRLARVHENAPQQTQSHDLGGLAATVWPFGPEPSKAATTNARSPASPASAASEASESSSEDSSTTSSSSSSGSTTTSSSSSSSSGSTSQPVSAQPPIQPTNDEAPRAEAAASTTTPATRGHGPGSGETLEGVTLVYEEHLAPGQPGHYTRWRVTCPLSKSTHRHKLPCGKSRSAAMTMVHGPIEPKAFLGCWLRAALGCTSREEHMTWTPSAEELAAYVDELRAHA